MAADSSGDSMLLKVAVFGIAMSVMCSALVTVLLVEDSGDYEYDEIVQYRQDLMSFSGDSMLNQTPWVLTGVYTPWSPEDGAEDHIADGWLFGESITDYSYLNKSANIKLDPNQKSSVPLSYSEDVASYETDGEREWWNDKGNYGGWFLKTTGLSEAIKWATDSNGYKQVTMTGNNWTYTGYRYVFDPTLPFTSESGGKTSTVDGSLSIVWYVYKAQEGLSGGIDIYGGDVLIASMNATDIISTYNTGSGYATTYEWDFQGTILNLSIRFDADAISAGIPLMQAWTSGQWSMAVSSTSAGNFYDLDNSTSFSTSVGSVVSTFKKIYTFDIELGNSWGNMILWLLCGLPMTIAMLCVAFRIINSVKIIG